MENTITIRGHSDDCINIEGAIYEEFNHYFDDDSNTPCYLAFNDGTILSIQYGAGKEAMWRINRLVAGTAQYEKIEATNDDDDYSDKVTLTGNISAVVFGTDYAKAHKKREVN